MTSHPVTSWHVPNPHCDLCGVVVLSGGLGRLLSLFVANQIMARGEIPYLHAYATNAAAIKLYESIGFRLRGSMNVAVVQHAG